jgi:hypothetical protein
MCICTRAANTGGMKKSMKGGVTAGIYILCLIKVCTKYRRTMLTVHECKRKTEGGLVGPEEEVVLIKNITTTK